MSAPLRLQAEDAADLEVIAAAAQDALVRVRDMSFDRRARRFAAVLNRFRWEAAGARGPYERIQSGLSFDGVLGVKTRNLRQDAPEALASVLSIVFTPAEEPPGGVVTITLAGGGDIALSVEALDALLIDMGAPWLTPRRPDHEKA
ncbi:MAG: DUF2948 family protein [Hyphomonadaceae bacterium]